VKPTPERIKTAAAYATAVAVVVSLPLALGGHVRRSFDGYAEARRESRIALGESQAIAILAVYARSQKIFAEEDLDGDGFYFHAADLGKLARHAPGLVPKGAREAGEAGGADGVAALEQGWRGYRYVVRPGPLPDEFSQLERDGLAVEMPELVAVPCEYGETGKRTFVVGADGKVYGADMGGGLSTKLPREEALAGPHMPARYNKTGLNTFVVNVTGTVFARGGQQASALTRFPDASDTSLHWVVCE